jgi:hypothetical protein
LSVSATLLTNLRAGGDHIAGRPRFVLKEKPRSRHPHPYFAGMPTRRRTNKDTPAKLAGRMKRRWRVVLVRAKGEILGTVEAPNAEAAKAAAAVQFNLDEVRRNRIMVQELA